MPRPGGAIFTNVGATPLVVTSGCGKKDVAIHMAPSGADTCKVEATLASPDDAGAMWVEIIAATNTSTILTLTGPYAALRFTRVTGATDLNKLTILSPSS